MDFGAFLLQSALNPSELKAQASLPQRSVFTTPYTIYSRPMCGGGATLTTHWINTIKMLISDLMRTNK